MIHLYSGERVSEVPYRNRFFTTLTLAWVFFILILLNLLPNGLQTPYLGVTVSATPNELLSVLGFSDSGNYLRGAIDLQDLVISGDSQWIFNLWPPGQMLLLAIVIKLGLPPVITLMVIFAFFWAVIGSVILIKAFNTKIWYVLCPCVLLIWFTDSPFLGWNQYEGALGTDGIGTAILCLLFIYFSNVWMKVTEGATFNPWSAGFAVSATLCFLSHLRIIFLFSIIFSFIIVLAAKITKQFSRNLNNSGQLFLGLVKPHINITLKTKLLLGILLTFSISLVPFSLYKFQLTDSISWSNSDYQWAQRWMTDEYLTKNNARFLVDGGANWACEIDPERCNLIQKLELSSETPYSGSNKYDFKEFRNLALISILRNPVGFLENRIVRLVKAFTADAGAPVGSNNNLLRGIAFLLMYLYLAVIGVAKLRRLDEFELFTLSILVSLLAPLFVAHFETRYLIPVQAFTFVVFTFHIASFCNRVKSE